MRIIKVQHTCENKGNSATILNNAPFRSTIKYLPNGHTKSEPFLGMGYYLWDNNMYWAHKWGIEHYNNNYRIVEGMLKVVDDFLFDLLANVEHSAMVYDIYNNYRSKAGKDEQITLCGIIELMKDIAQNTPDYFPYKLIRSEDKRKSSEPIPYSINQPNIINLKPCIIYCLIEIDRTILYDLKLIA